MLVRERRCHAAAWRAIQKPDLNQIRLDDLLDRIFLFMNGSRQRADADWSTAEFLDDRQQQSPIHFVETISIDFHPVQRIVRNLLVYAPVVIHFSVVAHATEQTVNDAWSAT